MVIFPFDEKIKKGKEARKPIFERPKKTAQLRSKTASSSTTQKVEVFLKGEKRLNFAPKQPLQFSTLCSRSYFAVTSWLLRSHFAVTTWLLRGRYGYYAVSTRLRRSLCGYHLATQSERAHIRD